MNSYPETNYKKALLGVARARQEVMKKIRGCTGCQQRRQALARGMQKIRELTR